MPFDYSHPVSQSFMDEVSGVFGSAILHFEFGGIDLGLLDLRWFLDVVF